MRENFYFCQPEKGCEPKSASKHLLQTTWHNGTSLKFTLFSISFSLRQYAIDESVFSISSFSCFAYFMSYLNFKTTNSTFESKSFFSALISDCLIFVVLHRSFCRKKKQKNIFLFAEDKLW